MFIYMAIITMALFTQAGFAVESSPQTLDELLAKVKALPNAKGVPGIFENIKGQNPELFKSLCGDIMSPAFYGKAESEGVTTLKRNAMITFCSGTTFEMANLRKATQKEKPTEGAREATQLRHREPEPRGAPETTASPQIKVQLRPVDFGTKASSVEKEQANLKAAQAIMLENAEKMGKKKEIESKLDNANQALEQAQDFYNNLGVAIIGMREDLKVISDSPDFPGFRFFNPSAHENDTPEQYMEALNRDLPQESRGVLTSDSEREIQAASRLLQQANEHLAIARHDLEAINKEMLTMVGQ